VGSPSAPTLTVSTTTATPGGVVAAIANGPANARDWIWAVGHGRLDIARLEVSNGTQSPMASGFSSAVVSFHDADGSRHLRAAAVR
jgi:hypothetical protein